MFGLASIQGVALTEYKFCISLTKDNEIIDNRVFNISSNKFESFEIASIDSLKTLYPFGLIIDVDKLNSVLSGEAVFWDLANSELCTQWYIGSPKTAPITLLFIYFQEVCNVDLMKKYWRHSYE